MKIILFLFFASSAFADFGIMPEHNKLNLGIGYDHLNSDENYDYQAYRVDLVYNNQLADYNRNRWFLSAEYGITPDLSVSAEGTWILEKVGAQAGPTFASDFGISDCYLGAQYNFYKDLPRTTFELMVTIPPYAAHVGALDQTSAGNGSIDITALANLSATVDRFTFYFSPGIVGRFEGYASAFVLNDGVEGRIDLGYLRFYTKFYYSMFDVLLYDSRIDTHDAFGAAGTYALLAGSPSYFSVGTKAGWNISKNLLAEFQVEKSTWGDRAANYFLIGADLVFTFDFGSHAPTKKLKAVPFNPKVEEQ